MSRVRVKVCGFTRPQDVSAGVAAGVDAFGFNLAKGPRKISSEQAGALVRLLPPFVVPVALFVNADEDAIRAAMTTSRCQVVQLHGDELPELAESLARDWPVIKAFRIRSEADLEHCRAYPADSYLLDAYVPGVEGGTGAAWDHHLLAGKDLGKPVIVAGGLRPDNVADAIAATGALAVDTASGVESEPAVKDADLMQRFVAACR